MCIKRDNTIIRERTTKHSTGVCHFNNRDRKLKRNTGNSVCQQVKGRKR